MTKLADTQLVMLSTAAGRTDGSILPLPDTLRLNKGAATIVVQSLIRKGFVAEVIASLDDEVWRIRDDGERLTLIITDQGLVALGIEPGAGDDDGRAMRETSSRVPTPSPPCTRAQTPHPKAGTKLGLLIRLLQRREGAAIPEIRAATGWQAHSMRGAISGTVRKKLGLKVTAELMADRGRVYHIMEGNQ